MKECTYQMRKSCKIWSACSEAYGGGEDLPPCTKESQTTDTQQRYAEISALVSELEDAIANFGRPYNIVTQLKRAVQKLQQ